MHIQLPNFRQSPVFPGASISASFEAQEILIFSVIHESTSQVHFYLQKPILTRMGTLVTDDFSARLGKEVARRRTFAIISHPDAGKTTLTEKLLLYGGAIHLAGAVKAKGQQRNTTSDWMEIERQRGISISTSVLRFEYGDIQVNLLDTPGHKDFSEDTYRTLVAVDSAVMLIDAAKGVEPQTRKLFEVCRMRGTTHLHFHQQIGSAGARSLRAYR